MEADGSTCPEGSNSTDCLLRTLLQLVNNNRKDDDAKTDWDPATFGLTLVIGVIAATFALIPIIQTIITTGRGGRKASERAIGKWSQKTTKQWSWSAMSFEFTARTPVLQEEGLAFWVERMVEKRAEEGPLEPKRSQRHGQNGFAASWLAFFEQTGLEMVIPTNNNNNYLRAVAVEYLPDDLVAAPAYADIGLIVQAAAVAGIQSLTTDKSTGYPIILGRGFQFDFRQHPVLGMVGAYSRYGPNPATSTIPTPEEFQLSLRYFHGIVDCEGIDEGQNEREINMVIGGLSTWLNIMSRYSKAFIKYHDSFMPVEDSLLRKTWKDYRAISVLFISRKPKTVPPFFPLSTLDGDIPLTLLALNGSYWPDANLHAFGEIPLSRNLPSWGSWKTLNIEYTESWAMIDPDVDGLMATLQESKKPHPKSVRCCSLLLEMSLMLLNGAETIGSWLEKRSSRTRDFLRSLILREIDEVDRGLGLHGHMSQYRTTVLYNTSAILYNSRKLFRVTETEGADGTKPADRQPDGVNARLQQDQDTATTRHYDIILGLRGLLQEFSLSPELTGAISKLDLEYDFSEPDQTDEFVKAVAKKSSDLSLVTRINNAEEGTSSVAMTHRMLLRLGAIVYRSDPKYQWLDWRELYKTVEPEATGLEDAKDLDDVIIYRCLLISLLFRTALDPTELIQSGLWKQVVPII